MLASALENADILIDDTRSATARRASSIRTPSPNTFPSSVHVSVLPFGASGPKADWDGEEVNLLHAGGEGFLLPNGLSHERFPERPPLKIYGHFAQYQGGCMAAFSALSAWWSAAETGGQYVDVSVQDAVLRWARSHYNDWETVPWNTEAPDASATAACSKPKAASSNYSHWKTASGKRWWSF